MSRLDLKKLGPTEEKKVLKHCWWWPLLNKESEVLKREERFIYKQVWLKKVGPIKKKAWATFDFGPVSIIHHLSRLRVKTRDRVMSLPTGRRRLHMWLGSLQLTVLTNHQSQKRPKMDGQDDFSSPYQTLHLVHNRAPHIKTYIQCWRSYDWCHPISEPPLSFPNPLWLWLREIHS